MRDNLLAHVWCRYTLAVAGAVKYKGEPSLIVAHRNARPNSSSKHATGVKSIQLRNTSSGWRVRGSFEIITSP
eukprot:406596-Hanusia_phi.AAC.1